MTPGELQKVLMLRRCSHHLALDLICADCDRAIKAVFDVSLELVDALDELVAAQKAGMVTLEGDFAGSLVISKAAKTHQQLRHALRDTEPPIPQSELTITVNGRECVLATGFVDYVDIARLSEFNHRTPNLIVTWWVGDRNGTLLPTPVDSVMLEDGMAFSVRLP